jgi:hypothetical protein
VRALSLAARASAKTAAVRCCSLQWISARAPGGRWYAVEVSAETGTSFIFPKVSHTVSCLQLWDGVGNAASLKSGISSAKKPYSTGKLAALRPELVV